MSEIMRERIADRCPEDSMTQERETVSSADQNTADCARSALDRLIAEHRYNLHTIHKLVQERDTLARRVEWQPIETAPKDGTRVLLGPARWTAEGVVTAYRRGDLWWIENADIRGSMRAFTPPEEDSTHWPFTHWMPLPAPPAQEGR